MPDHILPTEAHFIIDKVFSLISHHESLKSRSISLLPTENQLSPLATKALGSDLVNRYFLLDNTIWEYPQTDDLLELHNVATELFKKLYGVTHVNLRPISGLNCMTVLLAALTAPGDTVWSVDPAAGGHGATALVARRLGLDVSYLPFDTTKLDFDLERIKTSIARKRPRLIYIDMPNILFMPSLELLRAALDADILVHFDCSHVLGLLLAPEFMNPINCGFPIIAGSTHKTFPGPQKGFIGTNDSNLAQIIEGVTNSFISSHHVNSIAALCITGAEMLSFGREYATQILHNAKALAKALLNEGVSVQGRSATELTSTHQVWISSPNSFADPSEAVRVLKDAGIVVNCARIPTLGSKGLRLGTTEVTRLGMKESEMELIAKLLARVLIHGDSPAIVASAVQSLRTGFLTPQYCYPLNSLNGIVT
jgi:glycine hydroxymethyltransferase